MSYVINEIAEYLEDNSIGNIGTDIFCGYLPSITDGVLVKDTGGIAPENWGEIRNPTFQVFIKSDDLVSGNAKFEEIRSLLSNIRNTYLVVNSFHYFFINELSNGYLGVDENGVNLFSINFICKIRESVYIPQIQTGNPIGLLLGLTYKI